MSDIADYVDALDHIMRVARKSRTQSRRLRWIEARARCALEGGEDWKDLDLPKFSESNQRYLQARIAELEQQQQRPPSVDDFVTTFRCESGEVVGTTTAKIHSVSRHDDGVIEVVIDHWPQQPVEGEEIMVSTPYDVFILPLQPSELSSGPRLVVHVPGPEQPAQQAEAERAALEAENQRLRTALARVRELAAKWRAAPQNPAEPLLAMAADELDAAIQGA